MKMLLLEEKKIIEWCRLCCKEKVGFFYMINIVYIYDKMCYMFYLCC